MVFTKKQQRKLTKAIKSKSKILIYTDDSGSIEQKDIDAFLKL